MSDTAKNPYVGPRTFERNENAFFFGREQEARGLLSTVITEPIVLFYARSGAGKSSLLNMRLIPNLEKRAFQVLPVGRVGGSTTTAEEINNVFVYNLLQSIDQGQTATAQLAQQTIGSYLANATAHEDINTRKDPISRVLIIDQFEEIITTNLEYWQDRESFFYQLGQAVWQDPHLWVILSIREDYVTALQPFAPYLPGKLTTRFHMEPLGITAAHEAITQPAREANRPFAPTVADRLVKNLSQIRVQGQAAATYGQYVEPVQLQIVCYQLWENTTAAGQEEILAANLEQLGTVGTAVDNALTQFYQQALTTVRQSANIPEVTLRNWFEQKLITEAQTRGTAYQGPEKTAGLDNKIVNMLANQYLIRAEQRPSGRWYELIHDRFVEPILQDNRRWWSAQNPLIRAADEWVRSGRLESKLYQGQQFEEAFASIDLDALEPQVREFWEACDGLRKKYLLEETRLRTEREEAKAKAEARTKRRLRLFNYALAVAIVFTIAATIFAGISTSDAITQQDEANTQRTIASNLQSTADAASTRAVDSSANANAQSTEAAEQKAVAETESTRSLEQKATAEVESALALEQKATAEIESALANAQRGTADAQKQIADQQRVTVEAASTIVAQQADLFLAQSLAFSSLSPGDLNNDSELTTLLALEALHINDTHGGNLQPIIEQGLLPVVSNPYFNVTLDGHAGTAVTDVAFSPSDSRWLASADENGLVILWDLNQQNAAAQKLEDHQGAISAISITADGELISAGQDGAVYIRPLNDLTNVNTFAETTPIVDLAHKQTRNGLAIATSLLDGRVQLRYWSNGAFTEPITLVNGGSQETNQPIIFKNQSDVLLVGQEDGRYATVPLNRLNQQTSNNFHNRESITALAISSDDKDTASTSTLVHMDRLQGRNFSAREHTSIITDIVFFGQGSQQFITTGRDGTIRIWRHPPVGFNRPPPPTVLTGHQGAVLAVSVAPNGRFFATAGEDGDIRLWRLNVPLQTLNGGISVQFSNDGFLATVDGKDPVEADDDILLYSTDDLNSVLLYSMTHLTTESQSYESRNGFVNAIAFSQDGQTFLSGTNNGGENGVIVHWEYQGADTQTTFSKIIDRSPLYPAYEVDSLAPLSNLNNQQTLIAAAGFPSEDIGIWDWKGNILTRLIGHTSPVSTLAYSPEQHLLFSATSPSSADSTIRYWNLNEIDLTANTFRANTELTKGGANALAVSDSQQLLAAAQNNIHIWSLSDLSQPLYTLNNSGAGFRDIAISADGRWLIAAGNGLYLWRLEPDAEPFILSTRPGYVTADFSPDGRLIAAGTKTRTQIWPMIDQLPNIACQTVRRNLTLSEWHLYLGDRPYRPTCTNLPEQASLKNSELAAATPTPTHQPARPAFLPILLTLTATLTIVINRPTYTSHSSTGGSS